MIIDLDKLANIVDEACNSIPYGGCNKCPFSSTECRLTFVEMRKIVRIAKELTAVKPSSPTMAELVDFWEDR